VYKSIDKIHLKNVESASVATALAKYDLPVPGGPYNKNALQGRLLPKIDHGKPY